MSKFRKDLQCLINCHSFESQSNTPDFILAHFLEDCLKAFDTATTQRKMWHGNEESEPTTRQLTNHSSRPVDVSGKTGHKVRAA